MQRELELSLTIKTCLLRQGADPNLLPELVPLIAEQLVDDASAGVIAYCVTKLLGQCPQYLGKARVTAPPEEPGIDSIRPGMDKETRAGIQKAVERELRGIGVLPPDPLEQVGKADFDFDKIRKGMSAEERKAASDAIARVFMEGK
jgi:hypothetical protein